MYVPILEIDALEIDSAAFGYHFVVTVCIVVVHVFCTLMISSEKLYKHLTFFLSFFLAFQFYFLVQKTV